MIEKLNNFEISLIKKFKSHPLFINLDEIPWNDFLYILIQRRFFLIIYC